MIGLITLGGRCAGKRSAGNPQAAFDVAGTGNGVTAGRTEARFSKGDRRSHRKPVATAPVLDPTGRSGRDARYRYVRSAGNQGKRVDESVLTRFRNSMDGFSDLGSVVCNLGVLLHQLLVQHLDRRQRHPVGVDRVSSAAVQGSDRR